MVFKGENTLTKQKIDSHIKFVNGKYTVDIFYKQLRILSRALVA